MMAQMDGLELFLNLKEKPDTNGIPVIVLTVKSQFEDIKSANLLGVDEYMTKPFDPRDLNFKIKELLKKK
jgi:DNA-binding response OmpR family regulator